MAAIAQNSGPCGAATCWAADAHVAGPCGAAGQHAGQLMSGTVGFVRERQVKHSKLPCQLNFQVLVSGSHSVMTLCFCALVSIPVSRKQRHVMSESSAVTPYGHVQSPLVDPPKPADLHCPTPRIFSQRLNKDPRQGSKLLRLLVVRHKGVEKGTMLQFDCRAMLCLFSR